MHAHSEGFDYLHIDSLGFYTMSPNPLFTRIQIPLPENFYEAFTEFLHHGQIKYQKIPLLNRGDIKNQMLPRKEFDPIVS